MDLDQTTPTRTNQIKPHLSYQDQAPPTRTDWTRSRTGPAHQARPDRTEPCSPILDQTRHAPDQAPPTRSDQTYRGPAQQSGTTQNWVPPTRLRQDQTKPHSPGRARPDQVPYTWHVQTDERKQTTEAPPQTISKAEE